MNVPAGCDPELFDSEQLEDLLVQAPDAIDRIAEQVREGARAGRRPHTLLVGPSGRGKSHLMSTLRARLAADPKLAVAWLVHERGIAGIEDFLLRAIRSITPAEASPELADLSSVDRAEVVQDALTEVLDGRTLVLMLEDLEACFDGLGEIGRQALRAFLQGATPSAAIASTPRLFEAISSRAEPFFGFFQVHHLQELDGATCRRLASLAAEARGAVLAADAEFDGYLDAVRACLGGNSRLFALIGRHAADLGVSDPDRVLVAALADLAPRYRAVGYSLSPQQQKILAYLCNSRGARTVKEIAVAGAMAHQTASSQLKALRDAELVVAHAIGRESHYEVRSVLVRVMCVPVRSHIAEVLERVNTVARWRAEGGDLGAWLADVPDRETLGEAWRERTGDALPGVLERLWLASAEADPRALLDLDVEERTLLTAG